MNDDERTPPEAYNSNTIDARGLGGFIYTLMGPPPPPGYMFGIRPSPWGYWLIWGPHMAPGTRPTTMLPMWVLYIHIYKTTP
jgi:hypothetical protein